MIAQEIKEYIISHDKLKDLLLEIGCHNIYTNATMKDYRCALPNGDNASSVSINKETLFLRIYTKNIMGDIFALIGYIYQLDFLGSLKKVHFLLNIPYTKMVREIKDDPLAIFKKANSLSHYLGKKDNTFIENNFTECIEYYLPYPHISWIKDGISYKTSRIFNIRYDCDNGDIIIPWYSHNPTEPKIIGFNRRTTVEEYELLGIPKYNFSKYVYKSNYLYGLVQNYNSIQAKGYVVVGESEKFVLQRHSLGDETCVAIGCHSLSETQIQLLISLNVEIIICFDNDVEEDLVKEECEKFKGLRNIYYMYDKDNIMLPKSNAADNGNTIYNYMFKNKIKYER